MAKKDNDAPATPAEQPDDGSLDLGTRSFMHLGRPYTGTVRVGDKGPSHGEIEAEGFADLKAAKARADKADADREAAKQAIDAREDARREQIARDNV